MIRNLLIGLSLLLAAILAQAGYNNVPTSVNRGIFTPVSAPDTTAPSAVTDLTGLVGGSSSISLNWTSPGDDAVTGVLTGTFRIFYSSVAADMTGLTATSATTGTLLKTDISTSSVIPGSRQYSSIGSLQAGTQYFQRIFTADEVPNWSTVSNGSTATTTAASGWTSVGSFSADQEKINKDPFLSTTTATLEVGHVGICIAAVDNDGDGTDTNDFSGVMTDSAGNNWISAGENEVDPSASVAGAVVGIFYTTATFQLSAGGTIPFNLAAVKTAHAASCWEFTIPTGATVSLKGVEQKADDFNGTQVSSLTVSALSLGEHLFVRAWATETDTDDAPTFTDGWTPFISTGTTGSTNTSNMWVFGEFIIATSTDSQRSFPITATNTWDRASDMRAFDQTGP